MRTFDAVTAMAFVALEFALAGGAEDFDFGHAANQATDFSGEKVVRIAGLEPALRFHVGL
jgi:hypothetical protein